MVTSDKITAFYHALIPWSRVFKKLVVAYMFGKRNQKFDYHVGKEILPLNHILSHLSLVHTFTHCVFKNHFETTLLYIFALSRSLFCSEFATKSLYAFLISLLRSCKTVTSSKISIFFCTLHAEILPC